MLLGLTPEQWTAIGATAGIISVVIALIGVPLAVRAWRDHIVADLDNPVIRERFADTLRTPSPLRLYARSLETGLVLLDRWMGAYGDVAKGYGWCLAVAMAYAGVFILLPWAWSGRGTGFGEFILVADTANPWWLRAAALLSLAVGAILVFLALRHDKRIESWQTARAGRVLRLIGASDSVRAANLLVRALTFFTISALLVGFWWFIGREITILRLAVAVAVAGLALALSGLGLTALHVMFLLASPLAFLTRPRGEAWAERAAYLAGEREAAPETDLPRHSRLREAPGQHGTVNRETARKVAWWRIRQILLIYPLALVIAGFLLWGLWQLLQRWALSRLGCSGSPHSIVLRLTPASPFHSGPSAICLLASAANGHASRTPSPRRFHHPQDRMGAGRRAFPHAFQPSSVQGSTTAIPAWAKAPASRVTIEAFRDLPMPAIVASSTAIGRPIVARSRPRIAACSAALVSKGKIRPSRPRSRPETVPPGRKRLQVPFLCKASAVMGGFAALAMAV